MNIKDVKFFMYSVVYFFLLFISNLFIFRVIFVALLALTLGQTDFFQAIKENYKKLYTIILGLIVLLFVVMIIYSEISMIYGLTGSMLFHPDITWGLIPVFLILVFTNLIELPLFSYAPKLLKKKYMKLAFIALLLLLSSISIAWEASYRTVRDNEEFISYLGSMGDNLRDDIYRNYKNYSIDEVWTSAAIVNVIRFVHSVLGYKVANIYLTCLISFWYGKNYTLIALGAGVLIESYFTKTGLNLIKGISFDYSMELESNVTQFKEVPIHIYYYDTHLCAFSRVFITLFNQSRVTIAENLTANWFFNNIKLYDDRIVSFPETLMVNQNLYVTFSRSYKTWDSASWSMRYEPQQLMMLGVPYVMLFDLLTSIEFYKYEIEEIGIILVALYWTNPYLSRLKLLLKAKVPKKQNTY